MNPFLWQDPKDVENLIQRIHIAIDFLERIRKAGLPLGDASVVFELDLTAALGCRLSPSPLEDRSIDFMEACKSLEDTLLNFPQGQTVAYDPVIRRDRARAAKFWYPSAFPRLGNRDLLSSTDTGRSMRVVLRMKAGSFRNDRFLSLRDWIPKSDNKQRRLSDFMGYPAPRPAV